MLAFFLKRRACIYQMSYTWESLKYQLKSKKVLGWMWAIGHIYLVTFFYLQHSLSTCSYTYICGFGHLLKSAFTLLHTVYQVSVSHSALSYHSMHIPIIRLQKCTVLRAKSVPQFTAIYFAKSVQPLKVKYLQYWWMKKLKFMVNGLNMNIIHILYKVW